MADREKVIKALKLAASLVWNSNEGQCEIMDSDDALTVAHAIRDALELLKEQEPVRPQVLIDTWICGNCKTRLERQSMIGPNVLMDENFNYCPCCGKKVKWDEQ